MLDVQMVLSFVFTDNTVYALSHYALFEQPS
jgi:hypothetical protein